MPSNSRQSHVLSAHGEMLRARYASDPNTYVGSDLFLSHTKGMRSVTLAPDLFVAFGVPDRERSSYSVREEGKAPDFVLEVASPSTFKNDLEHKKDTYEWMGVREYCVFDPEGGMHWPRLQLYRLEAGLYEPVSLRGDPAGPMALTSETLGLVLRLDKDDLRLWDPEFEAFIPAPAEERSLRLEERARRIAAEQRAARSDELASRADQRASRADQRANQADQRANQADQRAELEAQARRKAEAEVAELKEWIRRNS